MRATDPAVLTDPTDLYGTGDSPPTDLVAVVHLLVLLQGAILVAGALEAFVFAAIFGPSGVATVVLATVAAGATLFAAAGVARRSRRARRLTLVAESAVLVLAVLEAVLGLLLVGVPLPPVAIVTRVILPIAVVVLLCRPDVRAGFGLAGGGAA